MFGLEHDVRLGEIQLKEKEQEGKLNDLKIKELR
jgi:hypothetical protein